MILKFIKMKHKSWFYLSLAVLFSLFSACDADWEKITVSANTAPDNLTVNKTTPFICKPDNKDSVAFIFSWSKADWGENVPITYILQFDLKGGNFSAPIEYIAGNSITEKEVIAGELNDIMHSLNQPVNAATDIDVRIAAKPMVLGSATPELQTMESTSKVTINLTSFGMAPLHILGAMFGPYPLGLYPDEDPNAWNPNNYTYVMFRDDLLGVDVYTARFYGFTSTTWAGEMTVLRDADLGKWNQIGKGGNGQLMQGGSNIQDITVTGYYTFKADLSTMTYSIESYNISNATDYTSIELTGVGSSPITLTQAMNNPHIWQVDNVNLELSNKLRFQANGSSQISWGSNDFPWGIGTSDGNDIPVNPVGRYFIKFNDLTGHYVFYKR